MAQVIKDSPTAVEPLLELRGIEKHFGPVQALYNVDLDLPAGQVTALVGDNGAGKSVLTKCIAGIYQVDHGQFFWEGRPVGQAIPFIIGRHVHRQVPQAQPAAPPPSTGVDYLGLVMAEHDDQLLGQIAYRDLPRDAAQDQRS